LLGLLHISCAFDIINYNILLERLALKLGIDDTALKWKESYLSDRSQTVVVGGARSATQVLVRGVKQGSCKGKKTHHSYAFRNVLRINCAQSSIAVCIATPLNT